MTTLTIPPGRAGARIEQLGGRVHLCGVYDTDGAPIYHDLAAADAFEVREIARAVRGTPGAVLDLAAGSGRFALPLLAAGHEVTALDLSPDMLALLRQRLDGAPGRIRSRCTTVEADMANFQLQQAFSSIVLGTTSISLLDDAGRAGLFRSVAGHLAPGGEFLFTVLERGDPDSPDEQVSRVVGVSGTEYDLHDHWPADAAIRTVTIVPADPPSGSVTVCTGEVGTSYPALIEDELATAGLVIAERRALTPATERHHVTLLKAVTR